MNEFKYDKFRIRFMSYAPFEMRVFPIFIYYIILSVFGIFITFKMFIKWRERKGSIPLHLLLAFNKNRPRGNHFLVIEPAEGEWLNGHSPHSFACLSTMVAFPWAVCGSQVHN